MNKPNFRIHLVAFAWAYTLLLAPVSCAIAEEHDTLIQGLQSLVGDDLVLRNSSAIQTFYISDLENTETVYIYWPENRMLMTLKDYVSSHRSWSKLILTARFTDLETDVVPESSDIGSSTYLETVSEISGRIRLATRGTVVMIITKTNSVVESGVEVID